MTPSKRAELRTTSSNNNSIQNSPGPGIDVPDARPSESLNDFPDSDSDSDSDSDEDSMDSGETTTQPNTTGT